MTGGIRDKERGAAEESRRGVSPHTLEYFFGFFTRENECVRFLFVQAANVLELRARAETQGKSLGSSFAIRRGREREMVFVDVPPARRFSNATRGRKVKFTKRKEQVPGASALLIAHRSFSLSLSIRAHFISPPLLSKCASSVQSSRAGAALWRRRRAEPREARESPR